MIENVHAFKDEDDFDDTGNFTNIDIKIVDNGYIITSVDYQGEELVEVAKTSKEVLTILKKSL